MAHQVDCGLLLGIGRKDVGKGDHAPLIPDHRNWKTAQVIEIKAPDRELLFLAVLIHQPLIRDGAHGCEVFVIDRCCQNLKTQPVAARALKGCAQFLAVAAVQREAVQGDNALFAHLVQRKPISAQSGR